jgi:hypothetical protein
MGTNEMYGDNMEMIANCKLCLKTKSLNHQFFAIGRVVIERMAFLLFNGELDNFHCDALLPAEKERLDNP